MQKKKITEMGRLTLEEFRRSDKLPLVVVLDNVRSMYNVGSVFRTADAYRVSAIHLCGITAAPYTPAGEPSPQHAELHKTALGAEDSVDWCYYASAQDSVRALREAGYAVYAVEQVHDSISLEAFTPPHDRPLAVVLGNEVKGVQQEVVDLCEGCIELPQFGTKHSLNVSTTAGIVIWEAWRKCTAPNNQSLEQSKN